MKLSEKYARLEYLTLKIREYEYEKTLLKKDIDECIDILFSKWYDHVEPVHKSSKIYKRPIINTVSGNVYTSIVDAARENNINVSTLHNNLSNRTKKNNYPFEYYTK